jgi:membrane-associated phospholipid phosphatase
MASQAKEFKKQIKNERALAAGTRVLLIVLVWCVQMFYIPTSHRLFGGIEPRLPVDHFPIWPIWVIPYVACYGIWLAGAIWAVLKMDDHLFRSMIAAFLLTCTISVSIYIFFPTYVRAEVIRGHDIFSALLRFIHENGGRYNAFPSGHVYITTLLAFFYNRWYPRYKGWWIFIPAIVSVSTLFTHQHFIVDIVGGVGVALLGYHFGLLWAGFQPIRGSDKNLLKPRS